MCSHVSKPACHAMLIQPGLDAGFSLVEIVMAIAIIAFAMMGLVGLLPVGLQSEKTSIEEMSACNLLRSIASDLANSPSSSSTSSRFCQPMPSSVTSTKEVELYISDSEAVVPQSSQARFKLYLRYIPAPTTMPGPSAVLIRVLWPASAANYQKSVESYVTFPNS
jgi:prepilin-type N-terminal cleavage/methylation domain-containing protein